MAISRTQIFCNFGTLLFNCKLAMQKLKINSILNIEQMHVNTATPNHLQLQVTTASRVLQTHMSQLKF
jgi:hypothetical protein